MKPDHTNRTSRKRFLAWLEKYIEQECFNDSEFAQEWEKIKRDLRALKASPLPTSSV